MRKGFGVRAVLFGCLALMLCGCEPRKEAVISLDAEGAQETDLLAGFPAPGTVLGIEEVVLYRDGQEESLQLQREQGSCGYSMAYDTRVLTLELTDAKDVLLPDGQNSPDAAEAYLTIEENVEYAVEELADELVLSCDWECSVEELTIGEEEYPATWICCTEESGQEALQVEYYLVGFETHVFQIRLVCKETATEELYENLQVALSTLRFDSIAEG